MIEPKETIVIFRKYPDTKHREGDVIALLPEIASSCTSSRFCDSVASDGWSSASVDVVVSQTRLATPAEYAGMLQYLETGESAIKVKAMKRQTPQMRANREKDWKRMQEV